MFFGLVGKVWLVAIGVELYFGLGIARVLHLVKTPSAAGMNANYTFYQKQQEPPPENRG